MLNAIHILLTYACTYECDHCFLHCSPNAKGTFSFEQIKNLLGQAKDTETVNMIYFEGGEPCLFYPLMLHSARLAHEMGFEIGIVTNGYWGTTEEDAEIWLKPLCDLRIKDISISEDTFHNPEGTVSPAPHAINAARKLGLPVGSICIEAPSVQESPSDGSNRGQPIVGGDVRFRGRAVDKLIKDLPARHWREFTECPDEDFVSPSRVHVDPYGYVHICQGICLGNLWQEPLSELLRSYDAGSHPICGPLMRGGPAALTEELGLKPDDKYVDACHLCYMLRCELIDRFPEQLAPRQVYGLE